MSRATLVVPGGPGERLRLLAGKEQPQDMCLVCV